MAMSRTLAQYEGIFTGPSGGGCLSAALEFAADETVCAPGSTVVAMLPDTGERYLSTPLFADIPADMTEEEKAIAESTPSKAPPGVELPAVTVEAVEFVQTTSATLAPVVVWSLEYCEFCWTAFGLFDAVGMHRDVDYGVINIDAFEYAKDNQGNAFRAALQEVTQCNTFPQIFIDGKFIGGAADACIMWKNGELQPILRAAGIQLPEESEEGAYNGDPFEFLPKWMSQNPLRSA